MATALAVPHTAFDEARYWPRRDRTSCHSGIYFQQPMKVLLVKTCPTNQMPFVNFERAIEAGIEDRRQRDHARVKGLPFSSRGVRLTPTRILGGRRWMRPEGTSISV